MCLEAKTICPLLETSPHQSSRGARRVISPSKSFGGVNPLTCINEEEEFISSFGAQRCNHQSTSPSGTDAATTPSPSSFVTHSRLIDGDCSPSLAPPPSKPMLRRMESSLEESMRRES